MSALNISENQTDYFSIYQPKSISIPSVESLVTMAQESEAARVTLTSRVLLQTPDPYLNTLGGVLSIAADAIWESPSYLHGSIGWRMRLNGWRGPYVADPLGWHAQLEAGADSRSSALRSRRRVRPEGHRDRHAR